MLSATAIQSYQRCPQLYDFRYNERIEAIEQGSILKVGKAVHAGLEVIKGGYSDYVGAVRSELQHVRALEATIAELMTHAWFGRYQNDGLEYVKNEFSWKVNIEGVDVQGIFDGIVKLPSGELALIEHKTTRADLKPNSFYWNKLIINTQVDLYNLVAKQLGFEISHIIYDVIRLPTLRLKKASPKPLERYKRASRCGMYQPGDLKPGQREHKETLKEYYSRAKDFIVDNVHDLLVRKQIFRTERDEEKSRRDLRLVAKLIKTGHYPRSPNNCHYGMYACDYLPVCSNETSLDNPNLYQIRKRR